MNDIAQKATADKFLSALQKEGLTKNEAGSIIGLVPAQVSYLFNEKYWSKLSNTYWDKVLAWVNSGQSLRVYSEKHGKVLQGKKDIPPVKETKPAAPPQEPIKPIVLKKEKAEVKQEPRMSKGNLIDMLIEEKELLKRKTDAINLLLEHYIS
jgi:hypothetical protein